MSNGAFEARGREGSILFIRKMIINRGNIFIFHDSSQDHTGERNSHVCPLIRKRVRSGAQASAARVMHRIQNRKQAQYPSADLDREASKDGIYTQRDLGTEYNQ